jgi:hypothetical protein
MGEIADMMIDGTLDFYTGEYIGRGHGYPRTTNRSLPWERRGKRPRAWYFNNSRSRKDSQALFGIKCFLYDNVPLKSYKKVNSYLNTIIAAYDKTPEEIQKEWSTFKKWVLETYPKQ